jgi:hypothetical protein
MISSEKIKYQGMDQSAINRKTSVKQVSRFFSKKALMRGGLVVSNAFVSKLPYVGVASQIALDMYVFAEIDGLEEKIEENKELIDKQNILIDRLNEEQNILNLKVDGLEETMISKFSDIDESIMQMAKDIDILESEISENKEALENLKDGIFKTAIGQLEEYFDSDKKDIEKLNLCINNFTILVKGETREDILLLVLNSLNVALIEKVLVDKKEGKDIKNSIDKIENNFNEILKSNNISLITNSFISMQEIFIDDETELDKLIKGYTKYFKKEFD